MDHSRELMSSWYSAELDAAEYFNECSVTLIFSECEVFRHHRDESASNPREL